MRPKFGIPIIKKMFEFDLSILCTLNVNGMDFDKFIFRKSQSCTKSHNKIIVNIYVLISYNISQRDKKNRFYFV